jgi:titin
MLFPSWLVSRSSRQSCAAARPGRIRPRRHASPPRLERLEDRAVPSAYLVTTTADGGTGSLRDAIAQVNADTSHTLYPSVSNASVDEIDFNITVASDMGGGYNATTGVATITPPSGLPSVTNSVLLDGYTQPGATANTLSRGDNAVLKIQLDLTSAPLSEFGTGLDVLASNVTIRGLVVNNLSNLGYAPSAIWLQGHGDQVQGCFLGTDVSGSTVVGGGGTDTVGIAIFDSASSAVIGGTTPAARNLIAGFGGGIVEGYNNSAAGNSLVEGNYIGTDATGTIALGNQVGIFLGDSLDSDGGIIGGLTSTPGTGAGNLISGNQTGIVCQTGYPALIQGNLIGTDATGTSALPNLTGILAGGHVLIGGNSMTDPAARNIISGNHIGIVDSYTSALIKGNYIGTDITGTQPLGNSVSGVWLRDGGETLGGTDAGDGNVISGNPIGVRMFGSDNVVQGNLIGTDYTGTNAVDRYAVGILAQDGGNNNLIAGNLISGNNNGIVMQENDGLMSGNVIEGNYIGTDITGRYAIGNGTGVFLNNNVTATTIGGTTAAARNLISGNGLGIAIGFSGVASAAIVPSYNVVEGNYIGTDVTGTTTTGTDSQPLGDGVRITGGITTRSAARCRLTATSSPAPAGGYESKVPTAAPASPSGETAIWCKATPSSWAPPWEFIPPTTPSAARPPGPATSSPVAAATACSSATAPPVSPSSATPSSAAAAWASTWTAAPTTTRQPRP